MLNHSLEQCFSTTSLQPLNFVRIMNFFASFNAGNVDVLLVCSIAWLKNKILALSIQCSVSYLHIRIFIRNALLTSFSVIASSVFAFIPGLGGNYAHYTVSLTVVLFDFFFHLQTISRTSIRPKGRL